MMVCITNPSFISRSVSLSSVIHINPDVPFCTSTVSSTERFATFWESARSEAAITLPAEIRNDQICSLNSHKSHEIGGFKSH